MARASSRPEAYPGEPLSSHLALTAIVAEMLYGERWRFAIETLGCRSLEPLLPLSALLHDIGKPLVATRRGTYPGHESIGAALVAEAAKRLLERGLLREAVLVALSAIPVKLHHHGMGPGREEAWRAARPRHARINTEAAADAVAEATGIYTRCSTRLGLRASGEAVRLANLVADELRRMHAAPRPEAYEAAWLLATDRRVRGCCCEAEAASQRETASRLTSILTGFVSVADAVAGGAGREAALNPQRYYARVLAEMTGHEEGRLARLWSRLLEARGCTHG